MRHKEATSENGSNFGSAVALFSCLKSSSKYRQGLLLGVIMSALPGLSSVSLKMNFLRAGKKGSDHEKSMNGFDACIRDFSSMPVCGGIRIPLTGTCDQLSKGKFTFKFYKSESSCFAA